MAELVGSPSDEVQEILATGRSGIGTIFVSMSARHPDGRDADYLEWHSLDHRPEQHRLASLRASLRLVSTPDCRAARAVDDARHGAVDHVMSYFFADTAGLAGFEALSAGLRGAGRTPYVLPPVARGVYSVTGRAVARRAKVGADVLPWWPARGVYILLERGAVAPVGITDEPGVAGAWWASGADDGTQLTYCFLDCDPVAAGRQLLGYLEKRWVATDLEPLLAAPFHLVAPYDWTRHLP